MQKDLLVIEDTLVHLSILRKIAAQAGFATSGVDSVAGAASVLEKRSFACITLDLNLGEQSGTEILQLLSEQKCRTPILIISAEDDRTRDVTMRAAKILGLNVYPPISKPVDLAALRKTLKDIADESDRQRIIRLTAR
jgi:DNA-binding NtrC family response regulator